jgi:putative membrane protein
MTGDVLMTLPETFWPGFLAALLYGPLGIFLAVLGFKVFDWISPRIDIQSELAEKQNLAVAIVCAAIILGICYVVASVVQ